MKQEYRYAALHVRTKRKPYGIKADFLKERKGTRDE